VGWSSSASRSSSSARAAWPTSTTATQDTSPTGNWIINLNLARDTGSAAPGTPEPAPLRLGTVTVKVQEFMPDRTKVREAHLSRETPEGWISPKELGAKDQCAEPVRYARAAAQGRSAADAVADLSGVPQLSGLCAL
jgi:hypothetical protein